MLSRSKNRYGYALLPPFHDDVIKWKHFPRYWPFVRGIHRAPVNSPHKGQLRGALMFFIYALNKRLSKQSWGWWFETISRPLWRHCNDISWKRTVDIFLSSCSHVFIKMQDVLPHEISIVLVMGLGVYHPMFFGSNAAEEPCIYQDDRMISTPILVVLIHCVIWRKEAV